MLTAVLLASAIASGSAAFDQAVERQSIVTITATDIGEGILSEITWDKGTLILQGVVANPDGTLSGRYLVVPATGATLQTMKTQPDGSAAYWERKARRVSPTGTGHIAVSSDSKMPLYGIGALERRMDDAAAMGGMRQRVVVRLNNLTIHERESDVEPYDGQMWSWSPIELNRIAYVDGKGDLWIARADGSRARRILKGDFLLPAWSDDGKAIAVAERRKDGRTWEISVVLLPADLRTPE